MKILKNLFSFFVVLLFTACSPYYYLPTKQNVNTFEKKGDLFAGLNAGYIDGQLGAEAGYAITDYLGVYSTFNRMDISYYGNVNQFAKDYFWDNELIFFKNFQFKNKFNFSINTAINLGAGIAGFNVGNPYYKLNLNRQYLQPSIGVTISDRFYWGFSSRFSLLNYKLKYKMNDWDDYDLMIAANYFILYGLNNPTLFFWEPALTWVVKFKYVKWNIQYSLAVPNYTTKIAHIPDNLTTSLVVDISKLFFNHQKSKSKLRWTL
jgi:hypothetical protein